MWLQYLVAAALAAHGLIHAMGFASSWHLGGAGAVSPTPTLMPGLGPASLPLRLAGLLWLGATALLLLAAAGLVAEAAWWREAAGAGALLSLALCLAWWHDAKAGALIDAVILASLLATGWPAPMLGA